MRFFSSLISKHKRTLIVSDYQSVVRHSRRQRLLDYFTSHYLYGTKNFKTIYHRKNIFLCGQCNMVGYALTKETNERASICRDFIEAGCPDGAHLMTTPTLQPRQIISPF